MQGGQVPFLWNIWWLFENWDKKHPPTLFTDWQSKKYPGTFRNQAQTPHTLFLDKKVPQVLFEILDKNRPPTLDIYLFHTPIAFFIYQKVNYHVKLLFYVQKSATDNFWNCWIRSTTHPKCSFFSLNCHFIQCIIKYMYL